MEQTTKIDVIFRIDTSKDWNGTVFALFPHSVNDTTGNVLSYQHIGQHSSADYKHCINKSKPATETQYNDLKKELEKIGYHLNIIKKQNYKKYLKNYYNQK
jgi:hypothetical protein